MIAIISEPKSVWDYAVGSDKLLGKDDFATEANSPIFLSQHYSSFLNRLCEQRSLVYCSGHLQGPIWGTSVKAGTERIAQT